ncbi:hypothetical protein [Marivita geojedonensis]|uniref:hypothetical protein n=1 Tax=Marivita geojedonensis TaxID=1123756 RepID=UPI00117E6D33|nr:hypothetical protein [Marivita geojedonensis]
MQHKKKALTDSGRHKPNPASQRVPLRHWRPMGHAAQVVDRIILLCHRPPNRVQAITERRTIGELHCPYPSLQSPQLAQLDWLLTFFRSIRFLHPQTAMKNANAIWIN